MEIKTNREAEMNFTTVTDAAQIMWDSEKRNSPYSTVCDPSDESYCESCDQTIDYSDGSKYGKCGCE